MQNDFAPHFQKPGPLHTPPHQHQPMPNQQPATNLCASLALQLPAVAADRIRQRRPSISAARGETRAVGAGFASAATGEAAKHAETITQGWPLHQPTCSRGSPAVHRAPAPPRPSTRRDARTVRQPRFQAACRARGQAASPPPAPPATKTAAGACLVWFCCVAAAAAESPLLPIQDATCADAGGCGPGCGAGGGAARRGRQGQAREALHQAGSGQRVRNARPGSCCVCGCVGCVDGAPSTSSLTPRPLQEGDIAHVVHSGYYGGQKIDSNPLLPNGDPEPMPVKLGRVCVCVALLIWGSCSELLCLCCLQGWDCRASV